MDHRQVLTRYPSTHREAGSPARSARRAPAPVLGALRRGRWDTAVRLAMGTGVTDLNQLTDTLFYLLHPEMRGKRILSGQQDLAREWIQIRDRYVRPVLDGRAGSSAGGAAKPGSARTSLGIDTAIGRSSRTRESFVAHTSFFASRTASGAVRPARPRKPEPSSPR
jgi:hypothetical protein